ncbi:MAG TPA: competence/damage-inducible protein A [Actinomycetota bacterium]|nr:competence/damage-inducible protein A [Actinomycetota bacterium]
MRAEIVGVGTELLLGQIANTNARVISRALAAIGIDVYFHTVVGDNPDRMIDTIRRAMERADAVVVTGGLGPTPDDITREAVAAAVGVALIRDEELVSYIKGVFEKLGRDMPENNLRQADLPEGATPIVPEGTAPGFSLESAGKIVFALPGVPWEMQAMLQKSVIPKLKELGGDQTILSREVLVVGLGESKAHELIHDIVEAQSNPTIAYRASAAQVRLRITAKASSESEALGLIDPVEKQIRERVGEDAVSGRHASLADALGEMLRERGATMAAAESLTGGLIAAEITKTSGAGDYFLGSIVSYHTAAKRDLVGVDEGILNGPGAISEAAAAALAEGVAQRFSADLGISATGVAGPTEQEGKPVGTIFVGATFGGKTEVRQVRGYGDRAHVQGIAVTSALDLGRRLVLRSG